MNLKSLFCAEHVARDSPIFNPSALKTRRLDCDRSDAHRFAMDQMHKAWGGMSSWTWTSGVGQGKMDAIVQGTRLSRAFLSLR